MIRFKYDGIKVRLAEEIKLTDPIDLESRNEYFYDKDKQKLYNYHDIKGVHLELTTKCNSNCVMCGRNAFGCTRSNLKLTELILKDCKRIFPSEFLK